MTTFENANCKDHDTETFFPHESDQAGSKAAKAICSGCPVQRECLDFALDLESSSRTSRHGIFGGLTPRQRADLSRKLAKEKAA